jgi:hypothetical protein
MWQVCLLVGMELEPIHTSTYKEALGVVSRMSANFRKFKFVMRPVAA